MNPTDRVTVDDEQHRNSTSFDYDNFLVSMFDDGHSTDRSSNSERNAKTDYRLSLPSSSQLQSYRLNFNSNLSERRKKFLSRIITVVAIFLLVVSILLVTLTLRLAHKIDELVRLKQLMPKPNTFILISTTSTSMNNFSSSNNRSLVDSFGTNLLSRTRTASSSSFSAD